MAAQPSHSDSPRHVGSHRITVAAPNILYAAQSPTFVNGVNNPGAVTRDRLSLSLPRGISFNNGFGRPWFANAPSGSPGDRAQPYHCCFELGAVEEKSRQSQLRFLDGMAEGIRSTISLAFVSYKIRSRPKKRY
jgi:hypothetical protein